jgi:hypothetical protein
MFWTYNKKTNEPAFCTSLKKVSVFTGLNYDNLWYRFGNKKNDDSFENDDFYIGRASSISEAMIAYAEKMNKFENVQHIATIDISGNKTSFFLQTVNE